MLARWPVPKRFNAYGDPSFGSVEATVDGHPLVLGTREQRAVLAMLALRTNAPVSTDGLIEGLWGDQPPPSAQQKVQLYVSQLRELLEGDGAEILTRDRGYELRLPEDSVDALRFERLVATAGRRERTSNGAAREDLSLWRGPPLADVADEPFAAAEIAASRSSGCGHASSRWARPTRSRPRRHPTRPRASRPPFSSPT
jgi:Transcriptional regulatory protein, C terminal/Bacterial transcriptional activator domain